MSVAILIELKDPAREEFYIPLATQGAYSAEWLPAARELGLTWLPLFLTGAPVEVEDLPAVLEELRRLRATLAADVRRSDIVERIDFALDKLRAVDPAEIASIFIG